MTDGSWSHDFTTRLPVPRAQAFAALTEPEQLRAWFAGDATVGATVGGPWQFWGRHILGAAATPHAGDLLREFAPPSRLAWTWHLEGMPTVVTLSLEEETQAGAVVTKLVVHHEMPGPLPHPRPVELVDDFWRLAFGNLTVHLTGGRGLLRPDFLDPHPEVRVSIVIAAPPAAVWQALMDPEALRQWVGATAPEVDPRVGGAYRYGWSYPMNGRQVEGGPKTILEMVPEQLLVTDWPDWRGDASMPLQRIEWHLEPVAEGTRVTVVHSGFTRTADISDYPFGWGWFGAELKRVVEAG